MTKELLQQTRWALVRESRGPSGGTQGPRQHSLGSTELNIHELENKKK